MCSGWRESSSATASANRTSQACVGRTTSTAALPALDVLDRRDVAGLADVPLDVAKRASAAPRGRVDDHALDLGPQRELRERLGLADLAEDPGRGVVDGGIRAGGRLVELGGRGPRGAMDRALLPPRPDLLGHVREEGREQPEQGREREPERRDRRSPVAAVGAALHELEVVVGEAPEEAFGHLERAGVLVALERAGGLVDRLGEPFQHRSVERIADLALAPLERGEGEPRGVQDLDREPAPDLDLLFVEGGVDAEASAPRPVPDGVGPVPLEDLERRHDVALGLRHLLAVGVQDEPADGRVRPRERAVLQVRFQDGVEEPGADDLVRLRAKVHREHAREEIVVVLPPPDDLRRDATTSPTCP